MKLKNSKESLKLKNLFPFLYGGALVLIILRTFQLTRYIDSETGFLTGGTLLNVLLYVIIAALSIYFVVASFLSADGGRLELAGLKDKGASVAAASFGVSLVYDCLSSLVDSLAAFDSMSADYFYSRTEAFKALMATGTLPYALQSVFALLSAIYVFILAKSYSKGSLSAHNHKYLALSPVAWAAFKLITRFVKQISYIKVSDLFLELILIAFMILFFVAFAQVTSGVYSDDSRWRITALGLSGALVSLCINVPRLVLSVFANEFVNKEYPFNLADAMFAVFAVFVVFAAVRADSQKTE